MRCLAIPNRPWLVHYCLRLAILLFTYANVRECRGWQPSTLCFSCGLVGAPTHARSDGRTVTRRVLGQLLLASHPALSFHAIRTLLTKSWQRRLSAAGPLLCAERQNGQGTSWTPQVLRFRDAVTKQEISIVGCAHGSPVSRELAQAEIRDSMSRHKKLGAVVIELCPSRWLCMAPEFYMNYRNESSFGALSQARSENIGVARWAKLNDVPIMLGDEDEQISSARVFDCLKQYFLDVINPFGGWQAMYDDFARVFPTLGKEGISESGLLLEGEKPIDWEDYVRRDFIAGVGDAAKERAETVPAWAWAWVLFLTAVGKLDVISSQVAEGTGDLAIFLLLALPITRVLWVPLLEERNVDLARAIRRAAAETKAPVVATLGLIHVNCVARLLMSEEIAAPERYLDTSRANGVWVKDLERKPASRR